MKAKYFCEKCGYAYDTAEEAKRCEDSHGEVITHQMSDEERQMYAEKKRKRYPWETKESKRDLDAHHIGAHRSPLFMWKRK